MSADLKPCPFCGEQPRESRHMDESHYSHAAVEFLRIVCDGCGAQSRCLEEHDEVIAAWNQRAEVQA
jgi:Lar family restriction alleviation protein